MALPKLDTPTFQLVVPSTAKQVKYRPYLVKEERNLMIAMESKDPKSMITSLLDLIDSCTFGELDTNKLTTFDIEYIFVQLRIASSGEVSKIAIKCSECSKEMKIDVELKDVSVVGEVLPTSKRTFQLNDQVGMVMKYATVFDLLKEGNVGDLNDYDATLETIIASIESIYDADNIYPAADHTHKELEDFIDSLSKSQMEALKPFFDEQPIVQYEMDHVCTHCNHKNDVKLEGLQSFF